MNISGQTKITGIFGDPVANSLSPAMHNAAFTYLKLPYIYVPFHVTPASLRAATAAIRALSLAGVNITVPHKEAVIPYLDRLDGFAGRCGAVNTIINRDGELVGYNTDGPGFTDSLRKDAGFEPAGKKIIILGAGGSARAVITQLLDEGAAEIIIINRTVTKVRSIADNLGEKRVSVVPLDGYSPGTATGAHLVVNTLSAPFRQEGGWLADLSAAAGALFCDLRYGGMPSDFTHYAGELKSPSMDGLGMLLYQGARAFQLFCGQDAPLEVMRGSLTTT